MAAFVLVRLTTITILFDVRILILESCLLISGIFTHISVPANSYRRPFIQGFWDGVDWILDNGNPLVYTNWASGQPEIANNKRFIKFRNGEWKTSIASNIRPVFCSYQQYM